MSSFRRFAPAALAALLILGAVPALAAEGGYSHAQWKDFGLRVMNFVAFFAILFFLLRKPVANFFRGRRENIARTMEYLETQARNLEEQTEIMNRQIADIASEREAILGQYERMGQKERDRIIEEANQAAGQIVEKARSAMEQEIKDARLQLMAELVELSTNMAAGLIKSGVDAEDQKRLTGEFMGQVENLSRKN